MVKLYTDLESATKEIERLYNLVNSCATRIQELRRELDVISGVDMTPYIMRYKRVLTRARNGEFINLDFDTVTGGDLELAKYILEYGLMPELMSAVQGCCV